jgi:hypothetical protein
MINWGAWIAVGVATLSGTGIKALVSLSYQMHFEGPCPSNPDETCLRPFAKPLFTGAFLFVGGFLVIFLDPCFDRYLNCLRSLSARAPDGPPPDKPDTPVSSINGDEEPLLLSVARDDAVDASTPPPEAPRLTCRERFNMHAMLCFLSLLDLLATILINGGLLFVAPSLVAAIRGLTTLWMLLVGQYVVPCLPSSFTAAFPERHDRLGRADYIGAIFTAVGVATAALVTILPTLDNDPSTAVGPASSPTEAAIGIAMVIFATIDQAFEILLEQISQQSFKTLSPPMFIGLESLYGAAWMALLLIIAQNVSVSPSVTQALDQSGLLEQTLGPGGTFDALSRDPGLIAMVFFQGFFAFVLCVALYGMPALGASVHMRTFALVGGRGLTLVVLELILYGASNGAIGLQPSWWALVDVVAVGLIVAGGYQMGVGQAIRKENRLVDVADAVE